MAPVEACTTKVGRMRDLLGATILSQLEVDAERLPWNENGYQFWNWKNGESSYNINYVEAGKSTNPPLVLIHGFGASAYHWRYNVPALAKNYHVFALDMLGFGLSDKPIIDYDADIWRDQITDFIINVVHKSRAESTPCVVAGNSIGGFTALYTAASCMLKGTNLVSGCILLNAAGRFRTPGSPIQTSTADSQSFIQMIAKFFQKLIITLTFYYTKQPARIAQVLRQVYINSTNVDDELVQVRQLQP